MLTRPTSFQSSKLPELVTALLADHCDRIWRRTDRMFGWLLLVEWLACIGVVLIISPTAWEGSRSYLHPHVWLATLTGGLAVAGPILMAWCYRGATTTRHVIAISQALISALFIHLTGGRIESHFLIFGSLAFLAFYRDWRVLITFSTIVTLDHLLRGRYWPESVFGFVAVSEWRWVEHACWIMFEDVFLIFSCQQSLAEMREIACRQADEVDATQGLERTILERTCELRHREEELRASRDRAEAASVAKSEFLANMSHEIRTPMTAILGYAELLYETGDIGRAPLQRLDAIRTIQNNSHHLLNVINDILDVSKIEAGKMTAELLPCQVTQLVNDVESLMRHRAESKQLIFTIEYEGTIPEHIRTDATRFKQILVNLVGNAIKFTEQGSIRVIIRFCDGATPRLEIDVIDSGIGIPADRQARLFEPFVQADNSMSRRFGGTGLGLTISRQLAEMLGGGLIIFYSQPGQGTVFRLWIGSGDVTGVTRIWPAVLAERQSRLSVCQASQETKSIAGARVLLAEDGMDNQRLIRFLLERAGAVVEMVDNGKKACDLALTSSLDGCRYDVILMDMQMPVMDGYEATTHLRASGYDAPIIALTAHVMADDRQKCIAAGCDDYIAKPIDRQVLIATIAAHLVPHPEFAAVP
jgi:signal transduction histidine kinase/ActR/RegA family two-component response regulator